MAAASVEASVEACLALLADVEGYPRWHPEVVRGVEVSERDRAGRASRARVELRLGFGQLAGSFEELMAVSVRPGEEVRLERIPHGAGDPERFEVRWRVTAGPPTRLELELSASLELPRLLPLGGLADSVAQGFVAAARLALSPDSPMTSASSS